MGFSSRIALLILLISLSPLIALHPAGGQGLPGNRDKPFDRPPTASPNLGKPNFKPDGKFKDGRVTPKLGDEKLIKKNPGQPSGDLPAAPRSTFQEKNLSSPNSRLNSKGANTSGRAQAGSENSQQPSSQETANNPEKLKNSTKNPDGLRSAQTPKGTASQACKSCRASCSSRWRTNCGSSTSCRSNYDACMRGCLDRGCSG